MSPPSPRRGERPAGVTGAGPSVTSALTRGSASQGWETPGTTHNVLGRDVPPQFQVTEGKAEPAPSAPASGARASLTREVRDGGPPGPR